MQHLPRVGVDRLRASVLLMRCAPPVRPRLRRRCNPTSQCQRSTHDHTPGHVPESGPSCGASGGGCTTPSPTDPRCKQINRYGGGESHRCQLRLNMRSATPPRTIDLSRSAAEKGEEDIWRDWRGTAPQQPRVEAPCGACGEPVIDRHRFAFASRLVHTDCVVENIQGGSDRGDYQFGVAIRERDGPPRRRTFRLIEILPRIRQPYDGGTEWGVHRRRQLERSWRSAIAEVEEAAKLGKNQHVEGRAREEGEAACTYRGLALDNSAGGSGDNHMRVPVPCPHGGFLHVSCMSERADRLARGHTDPRSRVACSCEWTDERRPPHPAESEGR